MSVKIKRIYDAAEESDGYRILVDRLWPRGIKKENAHLNEWLKEISPSSELREWFGHDDTKFQEFSERFKKELVTHSDELDRLADIAKKQVITLLYGAKNEHSNNAVVLKEVIDAR